MKTLYTGFKGIHNASYQLVSGMEGERVFFTNSFLGVGREVEALPLCYEKIVMFGVDKTLRRSIRMERCAEKGGVCLRSKLELTALQRRLADEGVGYAVSDRPTHYLCNEAYYEMLRKYGGRAVFLHIPTLPHLTEEITRGIRAAVSKTPDFT